MEMKMIANWETDGSYLSLQRTESNHIKFMIEDYEIDIDHETAQEVAQMLGKYIQDQEKAIREQLPWWKRLF